MPYHEFGAQKYEALGWTYRLADVEPPTKAQVQAAQDVFRRRGLVVI
jgi:pyruvate formate lyase activating enzyme